VLGQLIAALGGEVVALFDNHDVRSVLPGVPLYIGRAGFAQWLSTQRDADQVAGLVAVGGSRGRERLSLYSLFRASGLRDVTVVHPRAWVCSTASVGAGTQVLALASIAADARVGEGCIVNHGANIDHECEIDDGVHLAPGATLCGCVTVRRAAMIGAGAVVLPRLTIGEDAIVGAGAVVTEDVAPGVIVVGCPARVVSSISSKGDA